MRISRVILLWGFSEILTVGHAGLTWAQTLPLDAGRVLGVVFDGNDGGRAAVAVPKVYKTDPPHPPLTKEQDSQWRRRFGEDRSEAVKIVDERIARRTRYLEEKARELRTEMAKEDNVARGARYFRNLGILLLLGGVLSTWGAAAVSIGFVWAAAILFLAGGILAARFDGRAKRAAFRHHQLRDQHQKAADELGYDPKNSQ